MLRVSILRSREGEIRENTNKAKCSNINTDKHKDSFVWADNEVELLLKITLEYKLFACVLSKLSIVVCTCIQI